MALIRDGLTETIRAAIRSALQIAAGAKVLPHVDGNAEILFDGNRKVISRQEFDLAYDALHEVEEKYCKPYGYVKPYSVFTLISMRDKLESLLAERFYGKTLRVAFVVGGKDGCTYWRCEQPAAFLNKKFGDQISASVTNVVHFDVLSAYDVIVVQRCLFGPDTPAIMAVLNNLKQAGKKIIYETDDSLMDLVHDNACFFVITPPEAKAIAWATEIADGIFTTTKALANRLGYPEKTFILPNSMDMENFKYPIKDNPRRDDIIFALWAGGDSHEPDIAWLEKPLSNLISRRNALQDKTGKEIVFGFLGYFPKFLHQFTEHNFAARVENPGVSVTNKKVTISKEGKEAQVISVRGRSGIQYIKGVVPSDYHQFLTYLNPDIFFCPLLDKNNFNDYKSNIKVTEAIMAGAAVACSDVGPYKDVPSSCALKSRTAEQMVQDIQKLILSPDLRQELSSNGKKWTEIFFNIENNIDLWKDALFKVAGIDNDQRESREGNSEVNIPSDERNLLEGSTGSRA